MPNLKGGQAFRESEAITSAHVKCTTLSEERSLIDGSRKALVVSWICDISQHCLAQRPPVRPTVPMLVELGRLRFGDAFPAEQTIYNQYREWTAIWGKAYGELLTIRAPRLRSEKPSPSLERFQVGDKLDAGTVEHLKLIEQQSRVHEAEIRSLRAFIAQNIPAPAPGADGTVPQATRLPVPAIDWAPVRAWLRELDAGRLPFEVDDIGLRLTRRASANQRIMPGTVLAVVRSACGERR